MHLDDFHTVSYRRADTEATDEKRTTGPIKPRLFSRKDRKKQPTAKYRLIPDWTQPLALAGALAIGFLLGIVWTMTPLVCIFLACILTSTLIMSLQAKER